MTTAERELTNAECEKIAKQMYANIPRHEPWSDEKRDRALIRAGWQARAGAGLFPSVAYSTQHCDKHRGVPFTYTFWATNYASTRMVCPHCEPPPRAPGGCPVCGDDACPGNHPAGSVV